MDPHATTRTVVTGRVRAVDGPAAGAWVRLLDPAGEFVGEMVTSASGEFRFSVPPGHWVLRALTPHGVAEMPVEAEPGRAIDAELRLSERLPERLEIIQLATLSLGNRSYLITDGSVAVAVDPQRDLERITSVLEDRGLRLDTVVETHLHNDYVTGGLELARRYHATYAVPSGPPLGFDAVRVRGGDQLTAGELRIQVIATPGHTDHHLAYAFAPADGLPRLVCTGGSLLYGTTGRTDLMGADLAEPLARQQYRSVRHPAEVLPDDTVILPTHGFGSFCAATTAGAVQRSTIGRERAVNPVFRQAEDAFVTGTLTGLEPYPAYYRRMAPINAAGPPPRASLTGPRLADPAALADRITAGEWVVDVRPRAEYAPVHLPGTVNFDASGALATFLGWLVPFDAPLTLLAADHNDLQAARNELLRIGYDHLAAAAIGNPSGAAPRRGLPAQAGLVLELSSATAPASWGARARRCRRCSGGRRKMQRVCPGDLLAGQVGQPKVEDDQVGVGAGGQLQRPGAGCGRQDLVALALPGSHRPGGAAWARRRRSARLTSSQVTPAGSWAAWSSRSGSGAAGRAGCRPKAASRRLLETTVTLEMPIAIPARIGLSSPRAASGIRMVL
ncbi:putative Hydroxyacylglutathione hydrolase [Streptantibioticus cattleyicolor NRRL 8057 = DSM 46488]|nr:putative Hydroxyacylglutathione hydrolase [Streptantibioticus cattleyicolor NRRL 8057 = DSM 46488]